MLQLTNGVVHDLPIVLGGGGEKEVVAGSLSEAVIRNVRPVLPGDVRRHKRPRYRVEDEEIVKA